MISTSFGDGFFLRRRKGEYGNLSGMTDIPDFPAVDNSLNHPEAVLLRAYVQCQAAEISKLKATLREVANAIGINPAGLEPHGSPGDSPFFAGDHEGNGSTWARATSVGMRCLCGVTPPRGQFHSCTKPHPNRPAVCTSDAAGIPQAMDLIERLFGKLIAEEEVRPARTTAERRSSLLFCRQLCCCR